jgi:hypothetical protein
MNFYQIVVLGTMLAFFGGAGYYMMKGDTNGVLKQSITRDEVRVTLERMNQVTGDYTCDSSTGCKDNHTLSINDDGTAELDTTYSDGGEVMSERAHWSFGKKGYMTINLSGNQAGAYDTPKTILIRTIGTSTLSGLVYSIKQYQDMLNPIFVKNTDSSQN